MKCIMSNRILFSILWLMLQMKLADFSTIEEITQWAYDFRSVAFPPALQMTCLTYNIAFQTATEAFTKSCTLPPTTDTSYIADVRPNTNSDDTNFLNVFGIWLGENDNYDFQAAKCKDGLSCDRFLTFFNDKANEFGCSQAVCASVPGFPATATPYMYSVCKLDQPKPTGLPFVLSTTDGCTATSCPAAKPVCFSSQICCTSSDTACVDTTGVTCTTDLCAKKPGTYLKKCKKTCNNCNVCACTDTISLNCTYYQSYQYCTKYRNNMIESCPKTCNFCDKVRASNCPALTN